MSLGQRIKQRWSALSRRRQVHLVVLALLVVATIVHQLLLATWYIEDAAISFAYARNLAHGEGLVAVPGAERVEGYSNPLWVFLLAGGYLLGVDGFVSSKVLSCLFAGATVVLVYWLAREARPGRDDDGVPLLAAAVLAASAQFAIWNASGMENSLFNLLLAAAMWRTLVEARTGRWPWGACLFFGLAITRPEGILYAAFGGFWAMVLSVQERRSLVPTVKWLVVFFVPFGLYHWLRYQYFAWELPNTYYAKLGHREARPFAWGARAWKYIRRYSHELWQGYFLPVYVVGLLGTQAWRRWVAVGAMVCLGVVLLLPGPDLLRHSEWWPTVRMPSWWAEVRIWTLFALAALLPVLTIGRSGWRVLVLCWGMALMSLVFVHWSTGDWMKGFRWMSLLAVPASVLFAVGAAEVADAVQSWWPGDGRWRWPAWVAGIGVAALVLPPNVAHMSWFTARPETGPFSVKRRVNYMNHVRRRLHMDREINLDVDMGATVYWALPDTEIMDIAGLLDVPIAHHDFDKPFIHEYVFEERKPHFVHCHGGWARASRIPTHPEWKQEYFEIPGYPVGKRSLHMGNHIRKDLLVTEHWAGTDGREVHFSDGVTLQGWEVPASTSAPGAHLYVEVAMSSRPRAEEEAFRVLLFVADDDGHLASWDLPPGYDWYGSWEWGDAEVFHGRFSLALPPDLPSGGYDLGVVVLDAQGGFSPPAEGGVPDGAVVGGRGQGPARFAQGEVRWPAALALISPEELDGLSREEVARAMGAASAGQCGDAAAHWELATRRRTRDPQWRRGVRDEVRGALASCWSRRADQTEQLAQQVDLLERARLADRHNPDLVRVRRPVVEALMEVGQEAKAAGDWELAYRSFSSALRVDPSRAWARRWAEEARDHRLGLDPESLEREEQARKERIEEARERRKQRSREIMSAHPPPRGQPAEGGPEAEEPR